MNIVITGASRGIGREVALEFSKDPEISIGRAVEQLKGRKLLNEGDRMIVLSDILVDGKFIETVQIRIV